MKLKKEFITEMLGDKQMMIAVGKEKFNGVVKSNETAAFIVDQLKKGGSEEDFVDALLREYDVDRQIAQRDVRGVIEKLRSIGAIED